MDNLPNFLHLSPWGIRLETSKVLKKAKHLCSHPHHSAQTQSMWTAENRSVANTQPCCFLKAFCKKG